MKKCIPAKVCLLLAVVTASCHSQIEELNSSINDPYEQQISGEAKAIQTFI